MGDASPKAQFDFNLRDRTITCPARQTQPFHLGCHHRGSPRKRVATVSYDPSAQLERVATAELSTSPTTSCFRSACDEPPQHARAGRDYESEPTSNIASPTSSFVDKAKRARYLGQRKNLFDVRRASSVANLEALHLIDRTATADRIAAVMMWSSTRSGVLDLNAQQRTGASAYADAIALFLGIAAARYSNASSTLCSWNPGEKKEDIRFTFSRQALPMTWDYAEGNPFSASSGNFADNFETWLYKELLFLPKSPPTGKAVQADAAVQHISLNKVVSTDPPYYDNIAYADLSDFFYVWLRRSLKPMFPDLFATLAVPKSEELVAAAYRHGTKEKAESFFLDGMTQAMHRLADEAHPAFPVTIYYAFKQAESESEVGTASTGWETFLDAVLRAGFSITGTWPVRTEREGRSVGVGANALASSIVLVCRRRLSNAPSVSRREFLRELNAVLPESLDEMTKGSGDDRSPVAPVDLSQAIIGPGMAVFSKYAAVLEADGMPMSVRTALQLINRFLAEDDFDPDTPVLSPLVRAERLEAGEIRGCRYALPVQGHECRRREASGSRRIRRWR